jgi:hypothetical protein
MAEESWFYLLLTHRACEITYMYDIACVNTQLSMTMVEEPHTVYDLGLLKCAWQSDLITLPYEDTDRHHFIVSDSQGIIEPATIYFNRFPDLAYTNTLILKEVDVTATILFDGKPLFDAFYEGYKILLIPICPHANADPLYYTADSATYPEHGIYKGKMPIGKYTFRCINTESVIWNRVTYTPDEIDVNYDYAPTQQLEIDFNAEPVDGHYTMNIHRDEVLLIMEYTEDNCTVYNWDDLEWQIVVDGHDLGNLDCSPIFGIIVFKAAGTHIFCMGDICKTLYVDRRTQKIWFNKVIHPVQLDLDLAIDAEHIWNNEIKEIHLSVGYRCPRSIFNETVGRDYIINKSNYKPVMDITSILEKAMFDTFRGWYKIDLTFIFVSSAKTIVRTLEHNVLVNKYTFNFFFNTEEIFGNSLPCQLSFPFGEISESIPQYRNTTSNKKYNKVERIYQNFGKTEFDDLNLDTYEYKITTIDKDNKYGADNILLTVPLPIKINICTNTDPYETLGVIVSNSLVTVSADVFSNVAGSMYQVIVDFVEKDHPLDKYTFKSQILDAYNDSLLNYSFISPKFPRDDYKRYYYTITVQRVEDITNNVASKSNEIWYVRKLALYPTIPREFIHNCAWVDRCPYVIIDGYDSSIFGINKRDFIIDKPANQLLASINSQSFDSNLMDGSINTIDKYEDIELVIPIIFKMTDVTFQQQMSILNYIITRYLKNDRKNNIFRPHILKFSFDEYFYEAILSDEIEPNIDDDDIQKFTFDLKYTINPTKKYKNYMEIGDWDVEQNRMVMIGEVPLNTYISPLFIFKTEDFNPKDSVISIKIEEVISKQVFMIHGYVTKDKADPNAYGREFIIDISTKRIWMDKREITLDIPLIIGDIKLKNSYDIQFSIEHNFTIVYGKQYYDL